MIQETERRGDGGWGQLLPLGVSALLGVSFDQGAHQRFLCTVGPAYSSLQAEATAKNLILVGVLGFRRKAGSTGIPLPAAWQTRPGNRCAGYSRRRWLGTSHPGHSDTELPWGWSTRCTQYPHCRSCREGVVVSFRGGPPNSSKSALWGRTPEARESHSEHDPKV